jgi:hypothetical protein
MRRSRRAILGVESMILCEEYQKLNDALKEAISSRAICRSSPIQRDFSNASQRRQKSKLCKQRVDDAFLRLSAHTRTCAICTAR